MKHVAGLSALTLVFAATDALGQHYVSPGGSNEYPYHTLETAAHRIEDAIHAGLDEWYATLVWVAEGRYRENLLIPAGSEVRALVPGSCVLTPELVDPDVPVVTVANAAEFSGFVVDATGRRYGIACNGGTVRDCTVFGADRGADVNGGFVEGCAFLQNGYAGMYVSDVTVVYDTVVAGNQAGIYGIGDTGYSLLVHCTVTGNDRGVCNLDTMKVCMRDCIVWGNGADGAWDPFFSDITIPEYVGINGNISADPLFVGWGDFNDSDNPIYVGCSSNGQEHGTKEHPFQTISAALRAYDFRLSIGSPCIGTASDASNMGAFPTGGFPEGGPSSDPSPSVVINVAPGTYKEGVLMVREGVQLAANPLGGATIVPPGHHAAAWLRGTSSLDGFCLAGNFQEVIQCAPGSAPQVNRCHIHPAAVYGRESAIRACADARPITSASVIDGFPTAVEGGAVLTACTLVNNATAVLGRDQGEPPEIRNSIIWPPAGDGAASLVNVPSWSVSYSLVSDPALDGINGNIMADPQFLRPEDGDFRILPASPCIDAGFNDPELPDTDIAGMHRIMFGGKSFTVDMGAYEYYINELESGPGADETTLSWSSLADKTCSILYSDDLLSWQTAIANFPSAGNMTTSWTDDGSKTGVPPSLAPRRFYRILENP